MDEIDQRLKDTSKACIEAYEAWSSKEKDANATEVLQEAVHDLRKVASRLEIEMAVRDRKNSKSDPISIPAHKSTRKNKDIGEDVSILDPQDQQPPQQKPANTRRSGGGGGRGRRPNRSADNNKS